MRGWRVNELIFCYRNTHNLSQICVQISHKFMRKGSLLRLSSPPLALNKILDRWSLMVISNPQVTSKNMLSNPYCHTILTCSYLCPRLMCTTQVVCTWRLNHTSLTFTIVFESLLLPLHQVFRNPRATTHRNQQSIIVSLKQSLPSSTKSEIHFSIWSNKQLGYETYSEALSVEIEGCIHEQCPV